MFKKLIGLSILMAVLAGLAAGCGTKSSTEKKETEKQAAEKSEAKVVRLGFFPNITHSQALVSIARGDFQKALGNDVKLETKAFNAGPSVIEAIFAGQLDISYIGPNPAINGYIKSKGKAVRIVAGATSGGAVFVVRKDAGIESEKDFADKKFASPQLGNTQDVALKNYLKKNGYELTEKGGSVAVVPTQNPDILTLFKKKEIDGAWVPEPWGARLVKEGNGRIFLDERDLWPNGKFVTAQIIVRTEFLEKNPELVKKIVKTHVQLTDWINKNPDEAKKLVNEQIKALTQKALPEDVLDAGFRRLDVTYDPVSKSLLESAQSAYDLGFLGKEKPDLSKIYDLKILNEVLGEKGLAKVK
ncbi:MAG: ABC transporter substrate-binding protein [Actinobacteria bacterium]|nr:ABC transporter substrate-binding protein [Actinomycetota bacterium]